MKDNEHIEPSVIDKGSSYFNILECSINLLDHLDITYQRAFTESKVPEGFYQISPEQERYYDMMADNIIEANAGGDKTINNDDLHKKINQLKAEEEADHERNINNMTQVDHYKPPWKDKDATTVNNTVNDTSYTSLNPWNDDISYSSKRVETSKESITDTHIFDRVRKLTVGTTSVDPVIPGVGIIGQGGTRAISGGSITQGIIHGGEI